MSILCLDVGEKNIGVAASDALGITAQPLRVIKRGDIKEDLTQIEELIKEREIKRIVIGLPKNLKGEEGIQAKKVRDFAEVLQGKIEIPLYFWDERYTTAEAEKLLISFDLSRKKRKKVIDKTAAVLILQGYLDVFRENISL